MRSANAVCGKAGSSGRREREEAREGEPLASSDWRSSDGLEISRIPHKTDRISATLRGYFLLVPAAALDFSSPAGLPRASCSCLSVTGGLNSVVIALLSQPRFCRGGGCCSAYTAFLRFPIFADRLLCSERISSRILQTLQSSDISEHFN